MSYAVPTLQFPPWKKGKSVTDIMELAPAPHHVAQHRIEDAKGRPVAWLAVRLNLGDDSWRVIANKLAAACEMEAALVRLIDSNPDFGRERFAAALDVARAALAKARGEVG
jgi:hypothetical protein